MTHIEAGNVIEPLASSLGRWQSIETPPPRDTTLLAVYEPTESNTTYFGKVPATVHPFYVNEIGRFCDCGDWRPDTGIQRGTYRITHWMPLPSPPQALP